MSQFQSLKTWPQYFEALWDESKPFEVRENDRDFEVGDILYLKEWEPSEERYTKRELHAAVTYVMKGGKFGLDKNYVVLGIKPFRWVSSERPTFLKG